MSGYATNQELTEISLSRKRAFLVPSHSPCVLVTRTGNSARLIRKWSFHAHDLRAVVFRVSRLRDASAEARDRPAKRILSSPRIGRTRNLRPALDSRRSKSEISRLSCEPLVTSNRRSFTNGRLPTKLQLDDH